MRLGPRLKRRMNNDRVKKAMARDTPEYKNPRVRKGYNDAEDEYVRRGDPTYL